MRLRAAIVLAFTTARLSLPAATESLENVLERMDRWIWGPELGPIERIIQPICKW